MSHLPLSPTPFGHSQISLFTFAGNPGLVSSLQPYAHKMEALLRLYIVWTETSFAFDDPPLDDELAAGAACPSLLLRASISESSSWSS